MAFLNTYIAYIRWAVILAGFAAIFYAGYHMRAGEDAAEQARQQAALDAAYRAAVDKNQAIGLNLEHGLNDYKHRAKDIPHANDDSSGVFTINSVRAHTARIAAGKAATKRPD